jgi:nucleosome binding factor SPN SPT16 subunit
MTEELNRELIHSRMKIIYDSWAKAGKNDEYSAIADVDAIFLAAGEDEPVRKGTAFQTWLLGYEFPSTFILFQKDKLSILCSARKGAELLP